jgi:hypothetical protein
MIFSVFSKTKGLKHKWNKVLDQKWISKTKKIVIVLAEK